MFFFFLSSANISLVFLALTTLFVRSIHCACPSPESIVPCSCSEDENGDIEVQCDHPEMEGIAEALKTMSKKGLSVNLIEISSASTISIASTIFGSMRVTTAALDFPNLKSVNLDAFNNQEYCLKSLAFKRSKLSQIPVYAMTTLTSLERFEVSMSTEVEVVESNLFRPMQRTSRLETVVFTSDSISIIEKDAFFDLINLKSLNLRDNVITKIQLEALPPNLSTLEELVLW